jgi:hypothetical protein
MGRRSTRFGVLAVALTAASFAAAAPAGAAERFAAVGGTGGEPCLETAPCSIEVAINDANGGTNDDVTLLGGVPPAAPYVTSTALLIPTGVTVHGAAGARPVIETDPGSAIGIELNAASVLRDVVVEYSGTNFPAVRLTGGGLLERVTAHATPAAGSTSGGCATFDGGTPVIRDSICWHDQAGANGGGVEARNGSATPQTLTLRNVTAVSSNARPGLFAVRSGGGALTVNATNVIAQSGTGSDVGQIQGLSADAVNLAYSNYDSEADTSAGTITNPGSATNQTAPPQFVNAAAGDFRQLPTSAGTIDLGTAAGLLIGELDFEGQPRTSGAAPDIGADERQSPTTTTLACAPGSLTLGAGSSTCTATVTDTAGSPTTPTLSVAFTTDGAGTFSGAGSCSLTQVTPGQASCSVTYTPTAVGSGSHQITAGYGGDQTHEPSQGSTAVSVLSPPVAAPPAFDLAAAIKKCKKKRPKGPKRKKCIRRAKKRAGG